MNDVRIAPSIQCADPLNLQQAVERLKEADMLHLDVMDAHFVPNLALSFDAVRRIRCASPLPLDVHLMADEPLRWLDALVGVDRLAIHVESTNSPIRCLRAIRERKAKAGLALNPATPIASAVHVLEAADFVLLMAVEPGFSGQSFIPVVLDKIAELTRLREAAGLHFEIEVDGGLTVEWGKACRDAGAQVLVSGALCMFSGERALDEELRDLKAAWGSRGTCGCEHPNPRGESR